MDEESLGDKLQTLAAERDLELSLSKQKMDRDRQGREQQVREGAEEAFCAEKKDVIGRGTNLKRNKIRQTMAKIPDNEVVAEVGAKLLRRIDLGLEDEM